MRATPQQLERVATFSSCEVGLARSLCLVKSPWFKTLPAEAPLACLL
jgi:hypothetical protein